MKKIQINWPVIMAIALGVSLVSCNNEKMQEEHRKQQAWENLTTIEESFERTKEHLFEGYEIDEVIRPEESENGFSK